MKPFTPEKLLNFPQNNTSAKRGEKKKSSELKNNEMTLKTLGNIDKGNLRSSLLEFVFSFITFPQM